MQLVHSTRIRWRMRFTRLNRTCRSKAVVINRELNRRRIKETHPEDKRTFLAPVHRVYKRII